MVTDLGVRLFSAIIARGWLLLILACSKAQRLQQRPKPQGLQENAFSASERAQAKQAVGGRIAVPVRLKDLPKATQGGPISPGPTWGGPEE